MLSQCSHMTHMEISSLCAQIVCVSSRLPFESQRSHMYHMDISFLRAQFVDLSLAFLVELKFFSVLLCSYKDHQEMSSFHQSERGLTWIFNSFMQRLIMCS